MQTTSCIYVLTLLLLTTTCYSQVVGANNNNMTCPQLTPQTSLDLEQVMGSWYVVETVQHTIVAPGKERQKIATKGNLACAVFHLKLRNATTVLLEWEQQKPYPALEYTFTIPNVTSPGSWITEITPWSWKQGTAREQVHVMKAVGDHAVLTFCQPDAGVFTAVLGRRNHLTSQQIKGVNAMLQRRGLTVIKTQLMDEDHCHKQRAWSLGSGSGGKSTASPAQNWRTLTVTFLFPLWLLSLCL